MNIEYFSHLEKVLATERLDAYRQDGADEITTFSRYLLNMALCESLYSPLQFAEIALRNAMHAHLSSIFATDEWYNTIPTGKLLPWQSKQIIKAKNELHKARKPETPGGVIAELQFGFWTGFFNRKHARTGLGFSLVNNIFPSAPSHERSFAKLDSRWNQIRTLRNRVFHHERILHWRNLDDQHRKLLEVISWISPELQELAETLDRYSAIRTVGLTPWVEKIRNQWPKEIGNA